LNKPEDYKETCVISRNIPYQFEDELFKGKSMAGGVLGKGRIVWVQSSLETKKPSASAHPVSAYAEGIGIVSVDPRYLVRPTDSGPRINERPTKSHT
jgi:hypothetical protein